jgi:DNA polymerase III alpha subunit
MQEGKDTKLEKYIFTRSLLAANAERLLEHLAVIRQAGKIDAEDLFAIPSSGSAENKLILQTNITPKPKLTVLIEEKESLGLYVSGNPLDEYKSLVEYVQELCLTDDIHLVLINKIRKIFTKTNSMMFALALSTVSQDIEGVIFPKKALDFSPILAEKQLFWVKGKISTRGKRTFGKPAKTEEIPEDNAEYDEAPKLLIDGMQPFTKGVLDLFQDQKDTITVNRKEILQSLNWVLLEQTPDTYKNTEEAKKEDILPESDKQISNVSPEKILPTLKFPRSLGAHTLANIKQQLKQQPHPNCVEVFLEIEGIDGWKKAKGTFWIPQDVANQFA